MAGSFIERKGFKVNATKKYVMLHSKTDWLKQPITKCLVKITIPSWVKFRTNHIGLTNHQSS